MTETTSIPAAPAKRYLSATQIEEMGIMLLKEMVAAGETIVTSKEGAEKIRDLDKTEAIKHAIQEMALKAEIIKSNQKKPIHKYPSNYTPSPRRHRKKKTKY